MPVQTPSRIRTAAASGQLPSGAGVPSTIGASGPAAPASDALAPAAPAIDAPAPVAPASYAPTLAVPAIDVLAPASGTFGTAVLAIYAPAVREDIPLYAIDILSVLLFYGGRVHQGRCLFLSPSIS